jgi:hypothetical protein
MALFNRLIDEDFNQSHQANLINQLDCCGACRQRHPRPRAGVRLEQARFCRLGDVDTKVESFHQQDQVEEVYYPEVQQLLTREFPGTFVHDESQIGQRAGLCADSCIRCGRNCDL